MKQKIITFGAPPKPTPADHAQAKAASGKRRKRRRTGRHTLHHILILLAAAAIFTVLSLTVFFKIERLEVTGSNKYAEGEIIAQSGIEIGDNLFRISEGRVSKRLMEKFPYVEGVTLKRSFPPCLTIEIQQAKPLGAVDTATGHVIIGRSGKVLEIGAQEVPSGLTVVTGMYLYKPQVGRILGEGYQTDEQDEAKKEQEGLRMLTYLVDAVAQTGFENITMVDFSDRLNMVLVYDGRILIELGSEANLAYKLKFAKKVIEDELEKEFEGILDVSIDREVWTKPADLEENLSKRRLKAAGDVGETSSGEGTPALGTESLAQAASSIAEKNSESSSEASSSSEGSSSRNELEVIPNSAKPQNKQSETE